VADGVFYAELNELLTRELAEVGYAGVEVRVTPLRTEIIIRATRPQDVLGECCAGAAAAWSLELRLRAVHCAGGAGSSRWPSKPSQSHCQLM
jgi:hypothetical protein